VFKNTRMRNLGNAVTERQLCGSWQQAPRSTVHSEWPAAHSRLPIQPFDCESCVISLCRCFQNSPGELSEGQAVRSSTATELWVPISVLPKLCGTLGPTTNSVPKLIPASRITPTCSGSPHLALIRYSCTWPKTRKFNGLKSGAFVEHGAVCVCVCVGGWVREREREQHQPYSCIT